MSDRPYITCDRHGQSAYYCGYRSCPICACESFESSRRFRRIGRIVPIVVALALWWWFWVWIAI